MNTPDTSRRGALKTFILGIAALIFGRRVAQAQPVRYTIRVDPASSEPDRSGKVIFYNETGRWVPVYAEDTDRIVLP